MRYSKQGILEINISLDQSQKKRPIANSNASDGCKLLIRQTDNQLRKKAYFNIIF